MEKPRTKSKQAEKERVASVNWRERAKREGGKMEEKGSALSLRSRGGGRDGSRDWRGGGAVVA